MRIKQQVVKYYPLYAKVRIDKVLKICHIFPLNEEIISVSTTTQMSESFLNNRVNPNRAYANYATFYHRQMNFTNFHHLADD